MIWVEIANLWLRHNIEKCFENTDRSEDTYICTYLNIMTKDILDFTTILK